ncbi:MAG: HAD family phosphatase [Acidimicrobiales bacterium]
MIVSTLVLDCDGVIRHWDRDQFAAVAQLAGCDPRALAEIAFDPDLLGPAMVGDRTAEAWAEEIGRRVGAAHGVDAAVVAERFLALGWRIDDEVVGIARQVRASGHRVAILSNATTRLEADLASEGLTDEVDVVLSSARLGLAKPDPAIYRAAADALGVGPEACVFIDDRADNVDGARVAGMVAEVFSGAGPLAQLLGELGLLESA